MAGTPSGYGDSSPAAIRPSPAKPKKLKREVSALVLQTELDMLYGNINRMILTRNKEELKTMFDSALRRIELIYELQNKLLENVKP